MHCHGEQRLNSGCLWLHSRGANQLQAVLGLWASGARFTVNPVWSRFYHLCVNVYGKGLETFFFFSDLMSLCQEYSKCLFHWREGGKVLQETKSPFQQVIRNL
jgi:hypothetical protein